MFSNPSRGDMVKLVYNLRARDDVQPEEFHRYWLEEFGPKVRSVAKAIRTRKYVQSHTVETPLNDALVESHGMAPLHEGITEVWWRASTISGPISGPENEGALKRLVDDESKIIDLARSTIFMTEEHESFDFTGSATPSPGSIQAS